MCVSSESKNWKLYCTDEMIISVVNYRDKEIASQWQKYVAKSCTSVIEITSK